MRHGVESLLAACEVLMSDVGEASMRAVAVRALTAYDELDDDGRLAFLTAIAKTYDVDPDRVRAAYRRWDASATTETGGEPELIELFDAVEPARQQLLRRLNYAPDATLALVEMRADLRRLAAGRPELRALDHDFHHLLKSWFNRGFLHLEEVTWDSPPRLHRHLLRYERVHPMADPAELRRRLEPADRSVHAFFHPATGDVPLIFVEVALARGIPDHITPILEPGPALPPAEADTAVLYSINNALDGLAGVSFGSFLIKQVIEQVGEEFPHLTTFATLSPIPGFRTWLDRHADRDDDLAALRRDLAASEHPAELAAAEIERIRPRLLDSLARYIALERRDDGRPVDPVARFHLGNGASAWRVNWPANPSPESWRQSYGAMVNYRYEPEHLVRRHEDFVRRHAVALGGPLRDAVPDSPAPLAASTPDTPGHQGGASPMNPFRTVYRSFAEQTQHHPDRALFELPDARRLTYGDTDAAAQRIAARLVADGVRPGDRVAMQVEKSPEAIALYLATLRIGGVFLPLNTAYTDAEMDYFIGDASPRVLVCAPDRLEANADRAGDELVVETLGVAGDGSLMDGVEFHDGVHEPAADDPAAILYTSGTTGRSKGAVLTHANLASNCEALRQSWRYTAEDRLIHALPIFHVHGLFVAVNLSVTTGASMHFLPRFDAEQIIDLLHKSTVLMGVPTFYTRLLKSDRLTPEACASMRLFVSGSAPLLAIDHAAFESRTGHAILERYGMTETNMITTNPYDGPRKPGTVGRPLPGVEIRVVDREHAKPLPDGEVGIVEVRGPNVFSGYWQMPEKTAAEFREDGYFVTGDLGRIDEDGYLCIVGRDKDLVISGGFNVYPKEIEELIDASPKVQESAVIGVPHPDFGETVVAVVVPAPGEELRPEELLDFIAGGLARFKQPRAIRIVDSLPRNVMGKVQKAELRQRYADLFTSTDH